MKVVCIHPYPDEKDGTDWGKAHLLKVYEAKRIHGRDRIKVRMETSSLIFNPTRFAKFFKEIQ